MRDTFSSAYACEDCGREHLSISAMMACTCDRYDEHGYARDLDGSEYAI